MESNQLNLTLNIILMHKIRMRSHSLVYAGIRKFHSHRYLTVPAHNFSNAFYELINTHLNLIDRSVVLDIAPVDECLSFKI